MNDNSTATHTMTVSFTAKQLIRDLDYDRPRKHAI